MIRLQYNKTVNNLDYVYQATNRVMFNVHTCIYVNVCVIYYIYISLSLSTYIYIYIETIHV